MFNMFTIFSTIKVFSFGVRLICGTADSGTAEPSELAEPKKWLFYYNYSTQLLLIWIITGSNYFNGQNNELQLYNYV